MLLLGFFLSGIHIHWSSHRQIHINLFFFVFQDDKQKIDWKKEKRHRETKIDRNRQKRGREKSSLSFFAWMTKRKRKCLKKNFIVFNKEFFTIFLDDHYEMMMMILDVKMMNLHVVLHVLPKLNSLIIILRRKKNISHFSCWSSIGNCITCFYTFCW